MASDLNLSEVALYWEQVLIMNDFQCRRLLQRILSLFDNSLLGVRVAILGFAYKSETGDAKGSLAKHLIQELLTYGAEVSIHDPLVSSHDILSELALGRTPGDELKGDKVEICPRPYDACCEAELVVITTDAAAYRALRWDKISTCLRGKRTVFDTREVVHKAELARHDVVVYKVGE